MWLGTAEDGARPAVRHRNRKILVSDEVRIGIEAQAVPQTGTRLRYGSGLRFAA